MAATLVSPLDCESGLPLPIAPTTCEWLPNDNPLVADIHHGIHPRLDPRLKGLAGTALRNCWLQLVERGRHNEGLYPYHQFYKGPPIETNEAEIFSTITLFCAGYLPSDVIDMNHGEPLKRRASRDEEEYFRTPSELDPFGYKYVFYRYEPIRNFFREYVTSQKIDDQHIHSRFIDEFFFTSDSERKQYLGHLLLVKAAEAATDRVHEKYRTYKKAELLHPAMPKVPTDLVKYKLGTSTQRNLLIPRLEESLRLHHGVELAA